MNINTSTSKTNFQMMSSGHVLILLHGWGCDWQIWSNQINPLSKQFKLIIPDLPAFGKSEITNNKIWSSENYVEWLSDFIKQTVKKDQRFTLVGHSFGGKVAALYAQELKPTNLKNLILVDSSGLPDQLNQNKQALSAIIKITPNFIKNTLNNNLKETILNKLGASTDNLHSSPLQKKILNKIVHENIATSLKKLNIKTIIIWGENDQDTPIRQAKKFFDLIPNSKLFIIKNAGHFPFIDSPSEFNNILSNSLTK